jgi:phosphatidylglycerophosphatase A
VAVAGIPLYLLMHAYLPLWGYGLATAAVTLAGVWIHQAGDRILGEKDSSRLVVDELAGFFVAMTAVPAFGVAPTWQLVVLGFVLERGIDIVKVPPARRIECRWPGGWGVVGDDVVAGVYTLLILQATMRLAPSLVGLA